MSKYGEPGFTFGKPEGEPIILRTRSLEQFTRDNLVEAGWEKVSDNEYVKTEGNFRYTIKRQDDGWLTYVDMLVGIRVIDPEYFEEEDECED